MVCVQFKGLWNEPFVYAEFQGQMFGRQALEKRQ